MVQSRDGALMCGMGNGAIVRLNIETEIGAFPLPAHRATVSCLAANSSHVWSGSFDRTVAVHTLDPPERIATLQGHTDCVTALAFANRGATCYSTDLSGHVICWDAATFERTSSVALNRAVFCAVCVPAPRCVRQRAMLRAWL